MRAAAETRRALVVGGGIAGPVLAMFLQRIGVEARVLEARAEPGDEAGAFLGLAPNGLDVLRTLGIDKDVTKHGVPTERIVFQNHRAKRLGDNPETLTTIKRGLLNRALREAAVGRGIPFLFGKRLTRVDTGGSAVSALFADGTVEQGDFLVGCDGIHSATRRSLFPAAPGPEYTGIVDCGAFTDTPAVPAADHVMRMTFGLDGFFGYQRVSPEEIYWFENHVVPQEPDRAELAAIPSASWREELLRRHAGDHAPVTDIIAATRGEVGRWPIYDLPGLPAWHRDRACLIGDAAHATSPHVGQGASLALEDAILLTKCLRDVPDVPAAFRTFEALRRARVAKIVKESRRTGNQKAPTNAVTRGLRDLVLPFFLKLGVKATDEIYRFRVDWDERVPAAGS